MKKWVSIILAMILCLSVSFSLAEDFTWPSKTIEIITSDSTGVGTDLLARTMAPYLEKELGVTIVVNTVSGGGCTLATQQLLDRPNDGSAMMVQQSAMISTKVWGTVDYDHRDLETVCNLTSSGNLLYAASKQSGITSFEDLIEKAKAAPGTIKVPCATGSSLILITGSMEKACGIQLAHVDAGGVAERIAAVLGGNIELCLLDYASMAPYIESGDFIPLAFTSEDMDVLPDVKTIKEYGYDWAQTPSPTALFFPKGTDAKFVEVMDAACAKVIADPEFIAQYTEVCGGVDLRDYRSTEETKEVWENARIEQEQTRDSLGF